MLRLNNVVHEEIASTKRLLEEIELRQPPSAHYTTLLDFFKQLCDYTLSVVESIPQYLNTKSKQRKQQEQILRRMIQLASYVVRQINSYCDCFEYADRLTVSSATMQLLNKLLGCVTSHRAFILRGTTEFNYLYNPIGQRLNDLASKLSNTISKLDNSFAILSFPLASNKNMLANCNLIHELGHLVVDSEGLTNKLNITLDKNKKDKVLEIIEKYARMGPQLDFLIAQRKDKITEVLGNWIHETMADCIGLRLLGPAHLFAFLQFIEPLGAYQRDDDEHPCSSTRINMMIEVLRILEWDKIIEKECPDLWQRAKDISVLARESDARADFNASAECLPIIFSDISKIIKELCNQHTYKPETLLAHKDPICGLLEQGVPPAETIDNSKKTNDFCSFDVVSIINVGWLFREKNYTSWEERFSQLDFIEKGDLLNRLLTKAIEITFVKEGGS